MSEIDQLREQITAAEKEIEYADFIDSTQRMNAVKAAARERIRTLKARIGEIEGKGGLVIAATGHRPDKLGGYSPRVADRLRELATIYLRDQKPVRGISGMAIGWDQAFAWACVDLNIPFIAAVPFAGQEQRWPNDVQRQYQTLLSLAYDVVCVTERYSMPIAKSMQKRNEWMVDNSDKMAALWDGSFGGTANCIRYAEHVGRPIENLWDRFKVPA